MSMQGINIRGTGAGIMFRVHLMDGSYAPVATGTTALRLYEIDGANDTFKYYDFNDNTFKSGGSATTETVNMTHNTGSGGGNTGIWKYKLASATGFTAPRTYLAVITNTNAVPSRVVQEFQYGGGEGNISFPTAASHVVAASVAQLDSLGITSADDLLAWLKAMTSKSATVPTGAGTYLASTDSLEALREQVDLVEGSGFASANDSLKAIKDYLVSIVAPIIVPLSGGGGGTGPGFVNECIGLVRKMTDMPSAGAKYNDDDILEMVQAAFGVTMADIGTINDHPVLARMNITLTPGITVYRLPPQVAEVWRVSKISSQTGLPEYEIWPTNHFDFSGAGHMLEGDTIRLGRDWNQTVTWEIMFTPSAEVYIHRSTAAAVAVDGTTLDLDTTPSVGAYDSRDNAFVGYYLRILSATTGAVQQRIITAQTSAGRVTLDRPLSPVPTGTIVYEVVPAFSNLLKHVVCLRAAMDIASNEGSRNKFQSLGQQLASKVRALRLMISKKQARFPHHLQGDTFDNPGRWGDAAYILP